MSRFRHFLRLGLFIVLVSATALLTGAKRQRADKASLPPTTLAAKAQVRVWKGELLSQRSLVVKCRTGEKNSVVSDLEHLDKGCHFGEYISVPAQDLTVEISEDGAGGAHLKSVPLHVVPEERVTLVIGENAAGLSVEIVKDSAHAGDDTTAELAIRNFVPTLQSLQVVIGDDVHVNLKSPDSFLQMRGLKREVLQVDTAGQQEPGKPLKWTNEVDFNTFRKATLLIYPDPYGRIRPRLMVDTVAAPAGALTR